jgi:NAD(P)-dependent dehydrogenase (short-subunit alcohol dehydrogenase family)
VESIIITGSRGLIGSVVAEHFRARAQVHELDLALGHDLSDERFVTAWFKEHRGAALVNLFALNDHIDEQAKESTLFSVSLESFRKFMEVNLTSLFSVCREYARNNDTGSIVNFTSTYGLVSPRPEMYPAGRQKHIGYGVSKAGVVQLTRHLAAHLAPRIRVNCVAPGGVAHQQAPEFQAAYSRFTPMGRMMRAEELTGILDYLTSSQSSYATGSVFVVDGGWTAI